jgi:hypothetical protein
MHSQTVQNTCLFLKDNSDSNLLSIPSTARNPEDFDGAIQSCLGTARNAAFF